MIEQPRDRARRTRSTRSSSAAIATARPARRTGRRTTASGPGAVPRRSATDSAFCLACHTAGDPADLVSPGPKGQTFTEPASLPGDARHAAGDRVALPRPGQRRVRRGRPEDRRLVDAATSPPTARRTPAAAAAWPRRPPGRVICGSCHNILYNDGGAHPRRTTPVATPRPGGRATCCWSRTRTTRRAPGAGTGRTRSAPRSAPAATPRSGNHHPLTGDVVPAERTAAAHRRAGAMPTRRARRGRSRTRPRTRWTATAATARTARTPTRDVAGAAHGARTSADGRPTRHILEVDGPGHRYTRPLSSSATTADLLPGLPGADSSTASVRMRDALARSPGGRARCWRFSGRARLARRRQRHAARHDAGAPGTSFAAPAPTATFPTRPRASGSG